VSEVLLRLVGAKAPYHARSMANLAKAEANTTPMWLIESSNQFKIEKFMELSFAELK
jgi:hypothetical protein